MNQAMYWTPENVEAIQKSGTRFIIFKEIPDDHTLALLANTTESNFILPDPVIGLERIEKGAKAIDQAKQHSMRWIQWHTETRHRIGLTMPDNSRLYFQGSQLSPSASCVGKDYSHEWRVCTTTNTGIFRIYYMQFLAHLAHANLRGALTLPKGTPFKPLEVMAPNWTFLSGLDGALRMGNHLAFFPKTTEEVVNSMPWINPICVIDCEGLESKGSNMFITSSGSTGGGNQEEDELDTALPGFNVIAFTPKQMSSVDGDKALGIQIVHEASQYSITPETAFTVHDVLRKYGSSRERMFLKFRALRFKELLAQDSIYGTYFTFNDNEANVMFRSSPGGNYTKIHTGQEGEWDAFEVARRISPNAAYSSLIMGEYSIRAEEYTRGGFASPQEMFDAYKGSVTTRISGFFHYIASDSTALSALQSREWSKFAQRISKEAPQANILQQRLENAYAQRS